MGVERIDYVYLETHNWGKAVKFWQQLGFRLALDLGRSGRLEPEGGGPGIFLEEVPADRPLAMQVYLRVVDEMKPESPAEVTRSWHDSHWGSRLMEVRDPDHRTFVLQSYDGRSQVKVGRIP